jgi:uncharacterized membrane protein
MTEPDLLHCCVTFAYFIVGAEAFWTGKCLHRLGSGPKSNQSTRHGIAEGWSLRQHYCENVISGSLKIRYIKIVFNDAFIY